MEGKTHEMKGPITTSDHNNAAWQEAAEVTHSTARSQVLTRIDHARMNIICNDIAAARKLIREVEKMLNQLEPHITAEHQPGLPASLIPVPGSPGSPATTVLTRAELRLLSLLATHLTYRQMAEQWSVSINTVRSQAQSLYCKLGVASRNEAVVRARVLALLTDDTIQLAVRLARKSRTGTSQSAENSVTS